LPSSARGAAGGGTDVFSLQSYLAWEAVAATPYVIEYRASFHLDAPRGQVWETIEHPENFQKWWGWLEDFSVEGPGDVLADGAVLHGVVCPPVPYRMRLHVELDRCRPPSRIDATVHGDLEGTASLVLESEGQTTKAEVAWRIEMMQRPMRVAARLARPLLTWGHDRVVDMTVSSFRRQLRHVWPDGTVS
jgi:carbon monoxide dehydrogenase subunit G